MPPKVTFTKDNVIQAAFEIADEQGITAVTARRVAERLGSSTAPVYSWFHSMEELRDEIVKRAKDMMFRYMLVPYTERAFLNMGTGYALFAREHRNLFRGMFLESDSYKSILDDLMKSLEKEMARNPLYADMPAANRNELLNTMRIFTHGLAALICVGLIEISGDREIMRTLSDVGGAVIAAAIAKTGKK